MTPEVVSMYNTFLKHANCIKGFKAGQKEDVEYDIQELANGYCKAELAHDSRKMNQYFSALMVRYWHLVPYYYSLRGAIEMDISDIVSLVAMGILKACRYKSWLDPKKAISKDLKGAEKCINRCICTVRLGEFAASNRQKRADRINNCSYDEIIETPEICVESESYSYYKDIITYLASKNLILEAAIIYSIYTGDGVPNQKFSVTSFINACTEPKSTFLSEFILLNNLDKKMVNTYFDKLLHLNTLTIKHRLKKALDNIKADNDIKSLLGM